MIQDIFQQQETTSEKAADTVSLLAKASCGTLTS